jgi:hypothetical protein
MTKARIKGISLLLLQGYPGISGFVNRAKARSGIRDCATADRE